MILVLLLFVRTFSVSKNRMFWNMFSGFDSVIGRCTSIALDNVLRVVFVSCMSYYMIDCIFLTVLDVGAQSVYLSVLTFVD